MARKLEELARQLAQAPDLAAGREALDATARDLSSRLTSGLLAVLSDPEDRRIPSPLREGLMMIMETWRGIERKLEEIDRQMVAAGRADATYRHLVTAPGYGPILSSAMAALVIDPGAFKRGCDFAASLGFLYFAPQFVELAFPGIGFQPPQAGLDLLP